MRPTSWPPASPGTGACSYRGIRERPLHFFRAEPDNVLDFQQVLFAVDEKDDDPFEVEDPLHFLDELVEDLFPLDGPIQEPADLVDGCKKAVFRLHFRLVFFQPVPTCSVFD